MGMATTSYRSSRLLLAAAVLVPLVTVTFGTSASAEQASVPSTNAPPYGASIALMDTGTCLIEDSVGIRCFGGNYSGQMANGERDTQGEAPVSQYTAPTISIPGGDPLQVAGDGSLMCALGADGTVSCWGDNDEGQTGQPPSDGITSPTAVAMPGDVEVAAIGAGAQMACALLVDGGVACWGDNGSAGLGDGTTDPSATPVPVDLPAGRTAVMLTVGDGVACAGLDDGRVTCWGRNVYDEALGDEQYAVSPTPPTRIDGQDVTAIDAARDRVCAIVDDGSLWCWGRTGPIGTDGTPPVEIPLGGESAIAIAVEQTYACVVVDTGSVGCWGDNTKGLLGIGDDTVTALAEPFENSTSVDLGVGNAARSVAVGANHVCVVLEDAAVACWGRGYDGRLGFDIGHFYAGDFLVGTDEPTSLIGHALDDVVEVAAASESACARTATGEVHCWGGNDHSQLGRPGPLQTLAGPALSFPNDDQPIQIDTAAETACAVMASGGVTCWGDNGNGEAGQISPGAPDVVSAPTYIPAKLGEVYVEVGVGSGFACGRQSSSIKCWGRNESGQLGNNGGDSFSGVLRPGGTAFTDLDVGGSHSCALLDDGTAACWGLGLLGRLGDDDTTNNLTAQTPIVVPPAIPSLTVSAIAAGGSHSCARLSNGRVGCFGNGSSGQLGSGDANHNHKIDSNEYLSDVLSIDRLALGYNHSCGVGRFLLNSYVYCWGSADRSELGNGTDPAALYLDALGPSTPMPGDQVPTALAAGTDFTCAALPDTTVTCWGAQDHGRLGLGLQLTGDVERAGSRVLSGPVVLAPSTDFVPDPDPDPSPDPDPDPDPDPSPDPDPNPDPEAIVPTDPARYWDTRDTGTFDGAFSGTGRLGDDEIYTIEIAGRGEIPTDARGIAANLTAIFADGPGFATLYPCSPTLPSTSTVNYALGQVVANNAIIPLDDDGNVCIFAKRGADFALDLNGYLPADSPITGITPARYAETRSGQETFDGTAQGEGALPAMTVREIPIAGRGAVPADATAVLVNLTAIFPEDPGFATLYPCGDRPQASSLNYDALAVVPNGAVAQLSDSGSLCVYSHATSHFVLDVTGYVPPGTGLITSVPARYIETRTGLQTVDGQGRTQAAVEGGTFIEVQIAGRNGIPADATAISGNLAAITPDAPGFATLYPCGVRPLTSNTNYSTGQVVANNTITKLSSTGAVCLYSHATADFILDINGWL